ncbi:hypothetical protein TRVL_06677 [Trypanosoma vivax]|uniref:Uncharacterized protein n=1 Tax=Trypanosoma vivax (strain Y486) TaxID=1055687 RepID=F9WS91_TRYVY|nr:hypothetical protein TRVL_06677 [Trypanosoma vivax]CCD20430.1 hypothetical protein TvY486_0032520 [Trypanosoma vivax Y486]|eukprot:CCD20430.1 hypothetical protein TvY486_0032520 [Trypanosoma vivax Y486]
MGAHDNAGNLRMRGRAQTVTGKIARSAVLLCCLMVLVGQRGGLAGDTGAMKHELAKLICGLSSALSRLGQKGSGKPEKTPEEEQRGEKAREEGRKGCEQVKEEVAMMVNASNGQLNETEGLLVVWSREESNYEHRIHTKGEGAGYFAGALNALLTELQRAATGSSYCLAAEGGGPAKAVPDNCPHAQSEGDRPRPGTVAEQLKKLLGAFAKQGTGEEADYLFTKETICEGLKEAINTAGQPYKLPLQDIFTLDQEGGRTRLTFRDERIEEELLKLEDYVDQVVKEREAMGQCLGIFVGGGTGKGAEYQTEDTKESQSPKAKVWQATVAVALRFAVSRLRLA